MVHEESWVSGATEKGPDATGRKYRVRFDYNAIANTDCGNTIAHLQELSHKSKKDVVP